MRIANSDESMTFSQGGFNLDNFIPNRVPYFSYTGSLPYSPCNGTYAYVVFDLTHGLNISDSIKYKLKNLIEMSSVDSVNGTNYLFFNKDGANSRENNRDQIYIDCQPVNEDGELLVNELTGKASINEVVWCDVKPFMYIILAAIVAIGITKATTYLFSKMKKGGTIPSTTS